MKIAFLSRHQNSIERGAEIFVSELAKRLSSKNEVNILTGSDSDSLRTILKGKYHIVIPINGRLQSLKVSLGRVIGGYKTLITGHSGRGWDDIWNILTKPNLFVALTNNQKDWATKFAWGSKIVKIPNGVDMDKFTHVGEKIKIDLPKPIILSVGALVWYKHHEKTIRALGLLKDISLMVVGAGPDKEKIESLGNKILGKRFKIVQAEYKDLPKIYRATDLFVLPSWEREAFGIVYLEAMASGLGIVAPNDASRNEIIGEAGVLVDVSDPRKFSQALEQALKEDWKERAINQAKKFSWEKIAQEYEEALEKI